MSILNQKLHLTVKDTKKGRTKTVMVLWFCPAFCGKGKMYWISYLQTQYVWDLFFNIFIKMKGFIFPLMGSSFCVP